MNDAFSGEHRHLAFDAHCCCFHICLGFPICTVYVLILAKNFLKLLTLNIYCQLLILNIYRIIAFFEL